MVKRHVPDPKTPAADQKWAALTQREKFIRAAREAGADETGEAMERAFSRAFPPRKVGETVAPHAGREAAKGSRRKGGPG